MEGGCGEGPPPFLFTLLSGHVAPPPFPGSTVVPGGTCSFGCACPRAILGRRPCQGFVASTVCASLGGIVTSSRTIVGIAQHWRTVPNAIGRIPPVWDFRHVQAAGVRRGRLSTSSLTLKSSKFWLRGPPVPTHKADNSSDRHTVRQRSFRATPPLNPVRKNRELISPRSIG